MVNIKVENCYSWLYTDNDNIKTAFWRALRYRDRNYFHSRLYKQKLWDGYNEFFKKESGRFLTGLLPEVEGALNYWDVKYEITDKRGQVEFRFSEIDDQFLQQWNTGDKPLTLFDYQVDLTNEAIKYKRGVIQAPTSSGKTNMMISILKALPQDTPTLILANKKSLVEQNYKELMKWGFDNVGRLYDKYKEPNIFTCATVQSLHKMEKVLPKIKCLIVDEVHEMMSKVPKKYYNKLKNCSIRIAVSATPFKFGGKDKTQKYSVKGYFGPVLLTDSVEGGILTTGELQDRGNLSPSRCTFFPIHEPEIPYEVYLDAVTIGIAENWGFHEIVSRLAKSLTGRSLILVDRIAHGDALAGLIPGSLWIQGKDDLESRNVVLDQLKESKKNTVAIATQQIFNTGINVFIHNLINAAGGKAEHQIIQRMGRGLRTVDDKEILNYYDFIYHINDYLLRHSRKRVKILKKEGHEIIMKDAVDF